VEEKGTMGVKGGVGKEDKGREGRKRRVERGNKVRRKRDVK
jgi:hypothetical protein